MRKNVTFPQVVSILFIDGNNCLYIDRTVRNTRISGRRESAERMLAEFVARSHPPFQVEKIVLVFDRTAQIFELDAIRVTSAAPEFPSTDDLFLHIARSTDDSDLMFVTSDKPLRGRLEHHGRRVMAGGLWFTLAARAMGFDPTDAITQDDWMADWWAARPAFD